MSPSKLSNLKPGVLVADTASTADVAAMVAQLTQHFPELVVVVAGKREDSAALMQLTATGRIFRFLLTPLSHGQTRLALEAAVTQHPDLPPQGHRLSAAAARRAASSKNYLVTYGALAAGLLVVIGGIWFGVSRFTGEPDAAAGGPAADARSADSPAACPRSPIPIQAELALAKEAFDQGKYLEPAGESALDYYRSALALDPNSDAAKDGIRSVVDKILERAEASLTRREAGRRDPQHRNGARHRRRRIRASSFLDTQIARERERLKLTPGRRKSATACKTLVDQANDRMQNGRLIAPANGSARDALVEARRLDPTDPNVAQSIRELSGLLTEEARKSLAAGKTRRSADLRRTPRVSWAPPARRWPRSSARSPTRTRAATAAAPPASRDAADGAGPNVDSMVADIRQRMTEGKLIDPPGDSARDMLANLRTAAPNAS